MKTNQFIHRFRPHQGIIEFNMLNQTAQLNFLELIVSVPIRGLLNLTKLRDGYKRRIRGLLFPSPSGDY